MRLLREKKRRETAKLSTVDFELFAETRLVIRSKGGSIQPLRLNRAQRYIHERLEAQLSEKGWVRALILKGRQQGCSTLIGARFYWKTINNRGFQTFILTHEIAATQNLFKMVNRFHDHLPEPERPETSASNAIELSFSNLDSGYAIGTAGTKAVGRSSTIQLFHGSEVAFWPHADEHASGILQAVPLEPGTEEILESTANGMGNDFHKRWQDAESGRGDFIAIFVPWYWQEEYRREPEPDFVLTNEEAEYAAAYDLALDQMAWRRNKMIELKDPLLFKQEYPATAAEAFQTTGHDSYIKPEEVLRARMSKGIEPIGPLVIGADPARFGDDRFSVAWRQARVVTKIESKNKLDVVTGANWLKQIIDDEDPARVFVDVGGLGAGTVDILHSWGGKYREKVIPINFGSPPQQPEIILPDGKKRPGPKNRRAEMWMRSKDWLNDPRGVHIPPIDTLQADACGPGYRYDMTQQLVLEGKEQMRARGVQSPDEWDAVALTFAEPVDDTPKRKPRGSAGGGGWMG